MLILTKTAKIPVTINEDDSNIRNIKWRALENSFYEAMCQGNLALRHYDALSLSIVPNELKDDGTSVSHRTRVDRILAEKRKYLSSSQTAGISGVAEVLYKSTKNDVFRGKKSRPTYRNNEQPIPIKSRGSYIIPIKDGKIQQYELKLNGFIQNWLTDEKINQVINDINEYRTEKAKSEKKKPELISINLADITKEQRGLMFRTIFSYKDHGHNTITGRIASGEYILCDSKLVYDKSKKELYFMATYKFESVQFILDPDRICGIDLGITIPVVCATNFNKNRIYIGSSDEIKHMRNKFQSIRRRNQRALGIRSKSNKYEQSKKEKNWYNSACHLMTREIIKFALANGCGTIHIEDSSILNKLNKKKENKELKKLWTPYTVSLILEYKCIEYGIKLIKVNPRNTSRRCSICGYISADNRKTQREFICLTCGNSINADYNAALNIAQMTNDDIKNGYSYIDVLKDAV